MKGNTAKEKGKSERI